MKEKSMRSKEKEIETRRGAQQGGHFSRQ